MINHGGNAMSPGMASHGRRGITPSNPDAVEILGDCGWVSWISDEARDLKEGVGTWISCMKRIRRWRVPPRWPVQDWFDEIQAESVVAVLEALNDYDASYDVPLWKFVGMRVQGRAIARYRKEWTYSLHQVFGDPVERGSEKPETVEVDLKVDLRWGLSHLEDLDRLIIERLFWKGETELNIALSLGVSQQWVNKRKKVAFAKLRKMIAG